MLYDVISYDDVTSALSSRVRKKYAFYCYMDFEKFFSLTYRLVKLFERPSYIHLTRDLDTVDTS